MKIGFFCVGYPTSPPFKKTSLGKKAGGSGKSMHSLIKNINTNRINTTIISIGDENKLQKEFPRENLSLYRYPSLGAYLDNNSFNNIISLNYIREPVKKDFDVIHCQFGYPGSALASLYYKNKKNTPMVFSIRGIKKADYGSLKRQLIVSLYLQTVYPIALKKSDIILVQSEGVLEKSTKLKNYMEKIRIVPNGVDFETFSEYNDESCEDMNVGNQEIIEDYSLTLLFVGSLVERKGIYTLIKAFEKVLGEYPDANLIIVGEGPLKSYIRSQAKKGSFLEKVDFMGYINDKVKLANIYSLADMLVLPSISEGFPRVLLESMAAGTPCLVSDISPNVSAIDDGEVGLVAEVSNPDDFSEKIIHFIEMDETQKQVLSENSIQYAKDHSWREVAKQMEEIYERLLEKR